MFDPGAANLDQKQVRRAVRLLMKINETPDKNAYKKIVAYETLESIPPEVKSAAQAILDQKYTYGIPERGGRRRDLGLGVDTLVVKVSIAGSGYGEWATQVSKGEDGEELDWEKYKDPQDSNPPTAYTREHGQKDEEIGGQLGNEPELMFAGPGGEGTTGGLAQYVGGISDTGSNSIANLVAKVPPLVEKTIKEACDEHGYDPDTPVILIRAHSRGAVAASRVAEKLKERYPAGKLELVMIDPVPGPLHSGQNWNIDLSGLDEFTLVYSVASGYLEGFTPQTVLGAHRIIISRQNHSVGLSEGFVYNGQRYKGSRLNSLEPGVYVDMNDNGESTIPLKFITDIDTAKNDIETAFKTRQTWKSDDDRMDIITGVLTRYFNGQLTEVIVEK